MSEWRSVKDHPPEKGGRYLVYEEKEEHMHNAAAFDYPYPCCDVNVAYFMRFGERWRWSSFETEKCTPTHWMQLPKAPR